jgi:hypothetical protein
MIFFAYIILHKNIVRENKLMIIRTRVCVKGVDIKE